MKPGQEHLACSRELARLTRERDYLVSLVEEMRDAAREEAKRARDPDFAQRVLVACAEMIDGTLPYLRQYSIDGRRK